MLAVYYQKLAIYPIVLGFNVSLGIAIIIFHALSHAAVRINYAENVANLLLISFCLGISLGEANVDENRNN